MNNKKQTTNLYKRQFVMLCLGLAAASHATAADWQLDKELTRVAFSVAGIAGTSGAFQRFDGQITGDLKDPTHLGAHFIIQAASVDTGLSLRDDALRGSSFFNVSKFPTVEFTSTQVTPIDAQHVKMRGDVIMLGVTKSVEFVISIDKPMIDPTTKNVIVRATSKGVLNRDDWGMNTFVPGVSHQIKIRVDGFLRSSNAAL
jgi:polyisoprenoid-binding protein YceI